MTSPVLTVDHNERRKLCKSAQSAKRLNLGCEGSSNSKAKSRSPELLATQCNEWIDF